MTVDEVRHFIGQPGTMVNAIVRRNDNDELAVRISKAALLESIAPLESGEKLTWFFVGNVLYI